jgi:hypothetical protein
VWRFTCAQAWEPRGSRDAQLRVVWIDGWTDSISVSNYTILVREVKVADNKLSMDTHWLLCPFCLSITSIVRLNQLISQLEIRATV